MPTARGILSSTIIAWRQLRPLLSQPERLRQLAQRTRLRLKTGGVSALKRWLLEQIQAASDYQQWIQAYDTLSDADRVAIIRHIDRLAYQPVISVVMPTYNTPERWLRLAIESVRKQLYPHWELCIADDASSHPHVRRVLEEYRVQDSRITVVWREQNGHISAASNSALAVAKGEFITLLDHDDELSQHALFLVAVELNAHPEAEVIYSDEDKIDTQRRRSDPYFKPDWNPDLFLGQNFVSHLGVYRATRVREVGGFRVGYEGSQDWDLAMRIIEQIPAAHIRHIPHVLYHWRTIAGSTAVAISQKDYAKSAQAKLLAAHFQRVGMEVDILPAGTAHWRVKYALPQSPPLVSLIVLSHSRCDALRRCVASIVQKTTYPRFELIIASGEASDTQTLDAVSRIAGKARLTFVRTAAADSDAARQNRAARAARGEVIGFLARHLAVITPDWLEEMVSHALRPEIGAVGALLYYPNDTIQQAGMILGGVGMASCAYAGQPRGYTGQVGRALLSHNLSVVSLACLVVRRKLFAEVGGLDETLPPLTCRSIDFCLRLSERGYRNLWTPHAEFYAYAPTSQGDENAPEEQARLVQAMTTLDQRWGARLLYDPAYNSNLALDRESFLLAFPPRAQKPWL